MQPDATGLLQSEGLKRIVGLLDFAASDQTAGGRVSEVAGQPLHNAALEGVRLGLRTR